MHLSCRVENIAFVGAPCSGKTTVLNELERLQITDTSDVSFSFIREIATQLLADRSREDPRRDPVKFQSEIALRQYMAEDLGLCRLLHRAEPIKIQITDRGVADAYVYLTSAQIKQLTEQSPEELTARYTAIFYFEPFHSDHMTDGNCFRMERADEVDGLAQKTKCIWSHHPNFVEIPVFPTVEERVAHTAERLEAMIGCRLFACEPRSVALP